MSSFQYQLYYTLSNLLYVQTHLTYCQTVWILAAKDCDILQQDLTSWNTWSHESNLKFNASKRKVLTVTRRKSPVIHEYLLGDVILQRVQGEKDLGVTISSNLSWDLHVT